MTDADPRLERLLQKVEDARTDAQLERAKAKLAVYQQAHK